MKQADYARVTGDQLFLQFSVSGQSGDLSVVDLHDVRFSIDGGPLVAHRQGKQARIVESFANGRIAELAHLRATRAVRRALRVRRLVAAGRVIALYAVYPLILIFLALALNLALHSRASRDVTDNVGTVPAPGMPPGARSATDSLPSPVGGKPAPQAGVPSIPAESIAKGLARGAESGKFVVRLGPAPGPNTGSPIYVFEDPLCPHCQELAPELAQLAKTRTVYVFPVTVVGGAESQFPAAASLC